MAFTESTVGTLGSGADYAASVGALQDWENNYDSDGGEQRAILITDIEDNVSFINWADDEDNIIEIVSSEEGAQRKISSSSGAQYVLEFDDTNITNVTINDIWTDGTLQTSYRIGIYYKSGGGTLLLNRVRVSNSPSSGLKLSSASDLTTVTLNNCIADNNAAHGFHPQATSCTLTYSNCGCFSNGADGFGTEDDATQINIFQNCLSMGNSNDFRDQPNGVTRLYNCVSGDATANYGNHNVKDSVASSQSSTGVFLDFAGGNFSRTKSDTDAFSITGSASLTPATDYHFATRKNDTIGPFDYILGRQTHRISKQFNGTDGFIDVGDVSASIKGISFWIKASVVVSHTDAILDLNGTDTITLVDDQVTATGFSGATLTRYVDGVAGSTLAANVWHHVFVDSDTGFSASNVHIGRAGSVYFGGYLRDVRLYTGTVSAGDIADIADIDKTCSTALETAGHWKLESSHPILAFDSSGNENHGGMAAADVTNDLESPVPFSFANEVGYSSSLFFDGVADYLTFPDTIKDSFLSSGDWSFYFDYVQGATTGVLFGTRSENNSGSAFGISEIKRVTHDDFEDDASSITNYNPPAPHPTSGDRVRWVATWENSTRSFAIYRNGSLGLVPGANNAIVTASAGVWAMTWTGGAYFTSGELIQIKVWRTNISDADADTLSTDGTLPSETPYADFALTDGVGSVISDSVGSSHGSSYSSPIWVVVPRDESDPTKDVRGDELSFSTATGPPNQRSLSMQLNMGF